jgi:hypothetical protein
VTAGCSRLKHNQEHEIVYVLSKQTFLRDRVAAVSNRVGVVQNGDQLTVLEHGRRFLKVQTAKGEIGWIEEHAVVDPNVVTGFDQLRQSHEHDPVIATAVLRDDGYLHLKPGRDTARYYLLPEGAKLQLLVRASVPKAVGPQASSSGSSYASKAAPAHAGKSAKDKAAAQRAVPALSASAPPATAATPGDAKEDSGTAPGAGAGASKGPPAEPPAMEDWWLVRDGQGKVGWVMSRRMDVDVPDEIAGYAEGQRIVGAYLLQKVNDPESNFPDKQAPEYVTVLNPYQDGLPYDFSQVRVFTWNLRKHRYETAFRQRNLQGYLPVTVAIQTLDKAGPVPTFQFKQGIGDAVSIDEATGAVRPAATETLTYRLDGALVKKVEPAAPAPVVQPAPAASAPATSASPAKGKAKAAANRRHRHKRGNSH